VCVWCVCVVSVWVVCDSESGVCEFVWCVRCVRVGVWCVCVV